MRAKGKKDIRKLVVKKDPTYDKILQDIWRHAKPLQKKQKGGPGIIAGEEHCKCVEKNLTWLIPDEIKATPNMTTGELFLLSAAAALHDIWKGVDPDGEEDHGDMGAELVKLKGQEFFPHKAERNIVRHIIRVHNTGDLNSVPEKCRPIHNGDSVDVAKLAAIFKLADLLHTDETRVKPKQKDLKKLYGVDRAKYVFRRALTGWNFNPDDEHAIQFFASPDTLEEYRIVMEGLQHTREELSTVAPKLGAIGYPFKLSDADVDNTDLLRKLKEEIDKRTSPLPGMYYYRENDKKYFWGREKETNELLGLVMGNEVSLLVGESGVGKSSLLHAGLVPNLRKFAMAPLISRPSNEPGRLFNSDDFKEYFPARFRFQSAVQTMEAIDSSAKQKNKQVVIILDQFEDVLQFPGRWNSELTSLLTAFITRRFRNLNLVIAYRSDRESQFGPIWQQASQKASGLPRTYLSALDAAATREILERIFGELQIGIERESDPDGDVLAYLAKLLEEETRKNRHDMPGVYPPYIQMMADWTTRNVPQDNKTITHAMFGEPGIVGRIVGEYLHANLAQLGVKMETAERLLGFLVDIKGEKARGDIDYLASALNIGRRETSGILRELLDRRLVRRIEGDVYEVAHDYLATIIEKGRSEADREFQHLRQTLRTLSASFRYWPQLLSPQQWRSLYLQRKRIVLEDSEIDFLLLNVLASIQLGKHCLCMFFLRNLSADDWIERCFALRHIKFDTGFGKSVDLAYPCFRLLAATGSALARDKTIIALSDLDASVRNAVEQTVDILVAHASFGELKSLLRDENERVRNAARQGLDSLIGRADLPQLKKLLTDKASPVRQSAAQALAKIGTQEELPQLKILLTDDDPAVRRTAARALARLGTRADLPKLRELLREGCSGTRLTAVEAIGRFGTRADRTSLTPLLLDGDWRVRRAAVQALVKIGTRADIPRLTPLLNEDTWDVRQAALLAVAELGTRADIPVLRPLLQDDDWRVRRVTVQALMKLGKGVDIPELRLLLKDSVSFVRVAAAQALADLGTQADLPELRKLLRDVEPEVRRAAILALGKLGVQTDLRELRTISLADETVNVRRAAIETAANLGTRRNLPTVVRMLLSDDSIDVQQAAIDALCRLGTREDLSQLNKLLTDRDFRVRWAAGKALRRSIGKEKLEKLLDEEFARLPLDVLSSFDIHLYAPKFAREILDGYPSHRHSRYSNTL